MSAYNIGYVAGAAIAIIVSVVFFLLIGRCNKSKNYDERQELIRGKAYRLGFFIFMIGTSLTIMFSKGLNLPIDSSDLSLCTLIISVCAYAIYCIFNDAYFGLIDQGKKVRFLVLFIASFMINLIEIIKVIREGAFLSTTADENGFTNMIVAILLFVVTACILIKDHMNKKLEGLNEES